MTDQTSLRALLAVLVEQSEALRAAGVLEVELDGFRVTLAPHQPGPDLADLLGGQEPAEAPPSADPMDDARTFGTDGRLPGFPRLHDHVMRRK